MAELEFDLGDAELEVLAVLWDEGPTAVRQVMNRLHDVGRELAYTTVMTVLTRLEQKGFVTSNKSGLAYVYRAKISRDRIRRLRLKELVHQLYDGAVGNLVVQLVRTSRFTPDEIAELQKLIDQLDRKKKRANP